MRKHTAKRKLKDTKPKNAQRGALAQIFKAKMELHYEEVSQTEQTLAAIELHGDLLMEELVMAERKVFQRIISIQCARVDRWHLHEHMFRPSIKIPIPASDADAISWTQILEEKMFYEIGQLIHLTNPSTSESSHIENFINRVRPNARKVEINGTQAQKDYAQAFILALSCSHRAHTQMRTVAVNEAERIKCKIPIHILHQDGTRTPLEYIPDSREHCSNCENERTSQKSLIEIGIICVENKSTTETDQSEIEEEKAPAVMYITRKQMRHKRTQTRSRALEFQSSKRLCTHGKIEVRERRAFDYQDQENRLSISDISDSSNFLSSQIAHREIYLREYSSHIDTSSTRAWYSRASTYFMASGVIIASFILYRVVTGKGDQDMDRALRAIESEGAKAIVTVAAARRIERDGCLTQ